MNTQDKMNIIAPTAMRAFDDNLTLDEVCSDCVSIAIENGVAFSEILPLVRQIGRDNGYIVELSDRKKNLLIDIRVPGPIECPTFAIMEELASTLSFTYDVPVSFAMLALKKTLRDKGQHVPTKPRLSGWKLCALECWQENPKDTDLQDVRKHLRANDFNHSLYTQSYHELFTALVAL